MTRMRRNRAMELPDYGPWFHGAPLEAARSILQSGFVSPREDLGKYAGHEDWEPIPGRVYVSQSPVVAAGYAAGGWPVEVPEGVLFEVQLPAGADVLLDEDLLFMQAGDRRAHVQSMSDEDLLQHLQFHHGHWSNPINLSVAARLPVVRAWRIRKSDWQEAELEWRFAEPDPAEVGSQRQRELRRLALWDVAEPVDGVLVPNRRVQVDKESVRIGAEALAQDIAGAVAAQAEQFYGTEDLTLVPLRESLLTVTRGPQRAIGLTTVSGEGWGVDVTANVVNSQSDLLVPSAKYLCNAMWPEAMGDIVVNLNGTFPVSRFLYPSGQLVDELYSILLHEVTHALDPRVRKVVCADEYDRDPSYDSGGTGYWNAPEEIKGYGQQVIDEVLDQYQRLSGKRAIALDAARKGRTLQQHLVEIGLRNSPTWQKIQTRMGERERRLILRDLYQELAEHGLV